MCLLESEKTCGQYNSTYTLIKALKTHIESLCI